MDSEKPSIETLRPVENYDNLFSIKNIIIIVLCVLLLLSFLGINLLNIGGNIIDTIIKLFGPLIAQILSIFGYTTGTLLNITADVAGDTAKTGIDIAEGTVQSIGNILKDASQGHVNQDSKNSLDNALKNNIFNQDKNKKEESKGNLDKAINESKNTSSSTHSPTPDTAENPIQKPITSNKAGWCLVGEYKGKRGCVEVTEQDKCLSGQVYPSQKMCLNPVLTPNISYTPKAPQPPVYTSGEFFNKIYPPISPGQ